MTDSAPVFAEKRSSTRSRRLRRGLCVFNDGASTYDVTVRNISPKGAKLVGTALVFLPRTFELRILEEAGGGYSARQAKIAWIRQDAVGVEFID